METYKNDFNRNEDYALWELHEIRNKIHKRIIKSSKDELNTKNIKKFKKLQKKYKKENHLQLT